MSASTLPSSLSSPIPSRLPQVGTTIFTVMSALAQQHGAINLGQGFPDFDCDPALVEAVHAAMLRGANQYPPMTGVPALRSRIASMLVDLYGRHYDVDTEITITAGATQALLTAVLCSVQPGDEVIVIEPAYDSYIPAIQLAGGIPVLVPMQRTAHGFAWDWPRIRAAITPRTRLLMLNSPHNPTGSVLTKEDLRALEELVGAYGIWIVSDEVYEHMVFSETNTEPTQSSNPLMTPNALRTHLSMATSPTLAARSFIVSSFGKTCHVTGWKVGYCAAPAQAMHEFRKVHQFNVFTVNTPMQHGLAAYLENPTHYQTLAAFYQRKRDFFRDGFRDDLAHTTFKLLDCAGTYFQTVEIQHINDLMGVADMTEAMDTTFCRWLTTKIGVAAIPLSAFYRDAKHPNTPHNLIRFCFAKQDSTLQNALLRLKQCINPS